MADTDAPSQLAQILLKQGEMSTQLAVISEQLRDLPDHELRLRRLEAWRYSHAAISITSVGAAVLSWMHHH